MSMYTRLTEIPSPSFAYFAGTNAIQLTTTILDHTRNVKRSSQTTLIVANDSVSAYPQQHDGTVVAHALSPTRSKLAVLREVVEKDKQKRYVEIWKQNSLEAMVDVTDSHASFYADEHLRSLQFSPSESSILYVAEANPPQGLTGGSEKFRFKPHFGEGIAGKKSPTIFIVSWSSSSPPKLTALSVQNASDVLFAQPVFSSDERRVYATGYEYTLDHRLLGIKYCYNRPSGIWELALSEADSEPNAKEGSDGAILSTTAPCIAKKLTSSTTSCRSPRLFTHGGQDTLIWLAGATGGPHAATSTLYTLNVTSPVSSTSARPAVLVYIPSTPIGPDAFPGLYPDYNLPGPAPAPFLILSGAGPYLVTHSIWRSRTTVVAVSVSDGKVQDLTPDDASGKLFSWRVLCTDGQSRIVVVRSALTVPAVVLLGEIRLSENGDLQVQWKVLWTPDVANDVKEALEGLAASIIPTPGREPTETIVLRSKKWDPKPGADLDVPPCILVTHGGPHSTMTTAFSHALAAFALEGYTISAPNYTGSLGFGEAAVQALPGNCGTLDVQDCIWSVRHIVDLGLAQEGTGKGEWFIYGGSHGGFLGAHLIGQYPDTFTAAILRNPVISAGEMASTDIPDWYYAEFGMPYPLASSPAWFESASFGPRAAPPVMKPDTFERVYGASPIAHVEKVKAGVLLMIGADDLRVAPRQGVEYYHALKAARSGSGGGEVEAGTRMEVEMLVFEGESHPLEGVEAGRVGWQAAKEFMARVKARVGA